MNATGFLKVFARTGSLDFARNLYATRPTGEVNQVDVAGAPIFYRVGTSDTELIYKIFLKPGRKAEYWLPPELEPRVILDIGANIGAASRYFAQHYPQAKIYAFEPVPENVSLLEKNTASHPRIKAFGVALGATEGTLAMKFSDSDSNKGGFSFHDAGTNSGKTVEVAVRTPASILEEVGVGDVDIIKIDTEGSEFDILTAFPESVLSSVRWIVGELHGNRDFALLDYLSKWFDFDVRKKMGKRLFIFHACNKSIAIPSSWRSGR